jgi:hypothetical protein
MSFGLCNAEGTFQQVQMKIFGPYIGRFIKVYLDNFAVWGLSFTYFSRKNCFLEAARLLMFIKPREVQDWF